MNALALQVRGLVQHRHWLNAGDRLGVAVSAGADSVALLRTMLELRNELGIVVSVVHFNHTLRGDESDADHAFVKDLASRHGLEFHDARGDVASRARERSLSTEAAAREARYEFFWPLIESNRLDKIATAHTLDDQAETVLLRLIRGTGTRGLGGIRPELTGPSPSRESRGSIIRPFLHTCRSEIESYLEYLNQPWREDSSNQDEHHTRNRVRRSLIPLLERDFNPEALERLADLATLAQAEEEYLEAELDRRVGSDLLNAMALKDLPLALRRRWVRAAAPPGLQLEFQHVEQILEAAAGGEDNAGSCNLPAGWTFHRQGDCLVFTPPRSQGGVTGALGESVLSSLRLPVPGRVSDPETGRQFEATRILLVSPPPGYNPEHLYAPHLLPSELTVRTWRFGDRFWPAHTKAPKKLKELFQGKVAAELRASWPVMVNERDSEEIIWVQGFAAPAHLRQGLGEREAILLRECLP